MDWLKLVLIIAGISAIVFYGLIGISICTGIVYLIKHRKKKK